jgi:uncharacterized repeat protein (TIGR03803 family)
MAQRISNWATTFAFIAVFAPVSAILAAQAAQAQTFKVIYSFTGHGSSDLPLAGLTIDQQGNLYGTTAWGGKFGVGTVYELQPTDSGFTYSLIHSFGNGSDGAFAWGGVTLGTGGILYGTTASGGTNDYGTVFKLHPPAGSCDSRSCPWAETVLHRFTGGSDGRNPQAGVVLDAKGNVYGTNVNGGGSRVGVVYEMKPTAGGWTFQTLYTFTDGQDGAYPSSLLLFDAAGNLYGTASSGGDPGCGGFGCGTVYKLTPSASGWTEHTLYSFQGGNDGGDPAAGLIADSDGNLYGATPGAINGGTVFELTPSGENWDFNLAYDIIGTGPGPVNNLVRDRAGNLYGTSWGDGAYGHGVVFKLTPTGGGWTYTSLHDFTGGTDGGNANAGLLMDSKGNLYGTTYQGGLESCARCGVVYEITPE